MYSQVNKIDAGSFVSDIVRYDYRTADLFRKYDIDFCCGGKWPLDAVCKNKNLETKSIVAELEKIVRQIPSNAALDFDSWDIDFLTDYVLNVHHRYLEKALPDVKEQISKFLDGHLKNYPELAILEEIINRFMKEIPPHMTKEEEIYFSVQFVTSPTLLNKGSAKLKGETDYRADKIDGIYKYLSGHANTFEEAVKLQNAMREKGFTDAFAVAYKGSNRITVKEAREALKKKN